MPRRRPYKYLPPVPSTSTVSQCFQGPPSVGDRIKATNLPRVLIGWSHQDDNPVALMEGQLWCSVHAGRFQIFLASRNRSKSPGEVVFCGIVNFTMIRMFHPYWATAGDLGVKPRDMAWRPFHLDKSNLRRMYHEFLHEHYGYDDDGDAIHPVPTHYNSAVVEDDDPNSLFIPPVPTQDVTQAKSPPAKGRAANVKAIRRGRLPKLRKPGRKIIRRPRGKKNKSPPSASIFGSDPFARDQSNSSRSSMTSHDYQRQAALDDGGSIKSDSRASSLVSRSGSAGNPISFDSASPALAGSHRNPIDLMDDVIAATEEQARAVGLDDADGDGNDETMAGFGDRDRMDASETLTALEVLRRQSASAGASANVNQSGRGSGTPNAIPAMPALSNGGVRETIEGPESPNAQAQGVSNTSMNSGLNDDDLQMIDPLKQEDDSEGVRTLGQTKHDPIELD